MCENSARNLVDSMLELGAANMRLGMVMADALLFNVSRREDMPATAQEEATVSAAPLIEEEEIELAASVIEQHLVDGYELGFQMILRLNFPRDKLRDIARAALSAARAGRTPEVVER